MPPEIYDILKTNGVLLVALALFAWWIGPRVDKLLDALIAFIGHMADVKPQLEKLAQAQGNACKFQTGAAPETLPLNRGVAAPAS